MDQSPLKLRRLMRADRQRTSRHRKRPSTNAANRPDRRAREVLSYPRANSGDEPLGTTALSARPRGERLYSALTCQLDRELACGRAQDGMDLPVGCSRRRLRSGSNSRRAGMRYRGWWYSTLAVTLQTYPCQSRTGSAEIAARIAA